MIKCEKCERPAEHLVIVSGLSSWADWPICDQCLIKNIMMKDRRMSFAEMEGYVNRYKKGMPIQIGDGDVVRPTANPARPDLDAMIEKSRNYVMSADETHEQRISFAYGNLPEESTGTIETVRKAAIKMYGPRAIDQAWAAVNALRPNDDGEGSTEFGYNNGLVDALEIIEKLGGRDPDCDTDL